MKIISELYCALQVYCLRSFCIFFHPDYTVGFGVTPNHTSRFAGFTAGRKFHPALKILI